MQIEGGHIDGQKSTSARFEALSLADVSGLFLITFCAYTVAVLVLIVERGLFKWAGASSTEHVQNAIVNRSTVINRNGWLLVSARRGIRQPLARWLRPRLGDAAYCEVIAALLAETAPK